MIYARKFLLITCLSLSATLCGMGQKPIGARVATAAKALGYGAVKKAVTGVLALPHLAVGNFKVLTKDPADLIEEYQDRWREGITKKKILKATKVTIYCLISLLADSEINRLLKFYLPRFYKGFFYSPYLKVKSTRLAALLTYTFLLNTVWQNDYSDSTDYNTSVEGMCRVPLARKSLGRHLVHIITPGIMYYNDRELIREHNLTKDCISTHVLGYLGSIFLRKLWGIYAH